MRIQVCSFCPDNLNQHCSDCFNIFMETGLMFLICPHFVFCMLWRRLRFISGFFLRCMFFVWGRVFWEFTGLAVFFNLEKNEFQVFLYLKFCGAPFCHSSVLINRTDTFPVKQLI